MRTATQIFSMVLSVTWLRFSLEPVGSKRPADMDRKRTVLRTVRVTMRGVCSECSLSVLACMYSSSSRNTTWW